MDSTEQIDDPRDNNKLAGGERTSFAWLALALMVFVVMFIVGLGFAEYRFGGTQVLLRYLRGEVVLVAPQQFELGLIKAGDAIVREAILYNNSSDSIRILGANTQCSCVLAENLPATVKPGESYKIHIRINPEANKKIEERIVLFTDHPFKPKLIVGVNGLTK